MKKRNLVLGIVIVSASLLILLGPIYYTILHPERARKVAAELQIYREIIAALPADGVYNADAGNGGSYKDAIHGFFQVEPPKGFTVEEKRDNTTLMSKRGEILPCSQVHFKADNIKIGASAHKAAHNNIDDDLEVILRLYRAEGIKIKRTRFITIDAVRGAEVLAKAADYYFLLVKYKKHGLDHSITVTCYPAANFPKIFKQEFLPFLRSYRSLEQK